MKRIFSFILAVSMLAAFTTCGSSQAASESTAPAASSETNSAESSVPEAPVSDAEDSTILNNGETTVGMIYFLDLQDGSIMTACYDDAGTEALGGDYLKVYIENAEITDADGNAMTLENMNRGCLMDVTFPGMVTMSIPAQISASKIVVTNNTPDGVSGYQGDY
jgi:mannitol-specific phosphotransferase system IIBC component